MLRERRLERRQRTLALAVLLFVGERGGDRGRVPVTEAALMSAIVMSA